jgi:hypothetical protein
MLIAIGITWVIYFAVGLSLTFSRDARSRKHKYEWGEL